MGKYDSQEMYFHQKDTKSAFNHPFYQYLRTYTHAAQRKQDMRRLSALEETSSSPTHPASVSNGKSLSSAVLQDA
jgi:hypothetical protein